MPDKEPPPQPADRKLPQSRMYLKSAQWGFSSMMEQKAEGYSFRFHIVGILAALRAVQHSLYAHDRLLSPVHKQVIGDWWRRTSNREQHPDLKFIKMARDLILKAGSFDANAIHTESSIGEGSNLRVTRMEYELTYYDVDGNRRDLREALDSALKWCERELDEIESRVPDSLHRAHPLTMTDLDEGCSEA
jgi:hypothetical protein